MITLLPILPLPLSELILIKTLHRCLDTDPLSSLAQLGTSPDIRFLYVNDDYPSPSSSFLRRSSLLPQHRRLLRPLPLIPPPLSLPTSGLQLLPRPHAPPSPQTQTALHLPLPKDHPCRPRNAIKPFVSKSTLFLPTSPATSVAGSPAQLQPDRSFNFFASRLGAAALVETLRAPLLESETTLQALREEVVRLKEHEEESQVAATNEREELHRELEEVRRKLDAERDLRTVETDALQERLELARLSSSPEQRQLERELGGVRKELYVEGCLRRSQREKDRKIIEALRGELGMARAIWMRRTPMSGKTEETDEESESEGLLRVVWVDLGRLWYQGSLELLQRVFPKGTSGLGRRASLPLSNQRIARSKRLLAGAKTSPTSPHLIAPTYLRR
jgi:hypothetical protein